MLFSNLIFEQWRIQIHTQSFFILWWLKVNYTDFYIIRQMNKFYTQTNTTYALCKNFCYSHLLLFFDILRISSLKNHIYIGDNMDCYTHFTHKDKFTIHYSMWLLFLIWYWNSVVFLHHFIFYFSNSQQNPFFPIYLD